MMATAPTKALEGGPGKLESVRDGSLALSEDTTRGKQPYYSKFLLLTMRILGRNSRVANKLSADA